MGPFEFWLSGYKIVGGTKGFCGCAGLSEQNPGWRRPCSWAVTSRRAVPGPPSSPESCLPQGISVCAVSSGEGDLSLETMADLPWGNVPKGVAPERGESYRAPPGSCAKLVQTP